MRRAALIAAASGWGAGWRQTEAGPAELRAFGLAEKLQAGGIEAHWRATIGSPRHWREVPGPSTEAIFDLVAAHAGALSKEVEAALREGEFPVILGGDHAIAMGSWAGVARANQGPLGLIWLDAHLDAHTPATTPSMNPHGMGAAALLGFGDPRFLDICGGVLAPEHLCYVGIRSFEAGEEALLTRLGVRVIKMAEVNARGMAAAMEEALAIATRGTGGFGVTIDLDGFD